MGVKDGKIKKRKGKRTFKKNKITFDEEIITKEVAKQIVGKIPNTVNTSKNDELENESLKDRYEGTQELQKANLIKKKAKRKAVQENEKPENERLENAEVNTNECFKGKNLELEQNSENENLTSEMINSEGLVKTTESKRSLKRKRHKLLLQEKHLKSELVNQQKSLNYLSSWKNCREVWKFEKLRQIWLQQNMYDVNKIPDNFFDIVVDYFANAKGKVKQAIIDEAIKIIESEENDNIEIDDAEKLKKQKKLLRAKHIVQSLEE